MENNLVINQVFSVPILTTFLDQDIVDYMQNLIIPRLSNLSNPNPNFEPSTDFHSTEKIVSDKELEKFIKVINSIYQEFSNKTEISFSTKAHYWIQDYKKNQIHGLHAHPNASISGVYYIRANEFAGKIEFLNPNPHSYFQPYVSYSHNEKYSKIEIEPTTGLLILFPSYLFHRVLPSFEDKVERTILAFNYYL